jgi:putative transposase
MDCLQSSKILQYLATERNKATMNTTKKAPVRELKPQFPSLENIQQELSTAKSIDDFFGKQGILARLFSSTLESMLEAELTEHLGYERYEAKGTLRVPNSGNSRNGKRSKQLRTSAGDTTIQLPRDRNSEFSSKLLAKHQTSTNELEEKILAMYGKGMSTRDIQNLLQETSGVNGHFHTHSKAREALKAFEVVTTMKLTQS